MFTMIKLRLGAPAPSLQEVLDLPGMRGLPLDESFGLVHLGKGDYVVRVKGQVTDFDTRSQMSPEMVGIFSDARIAPV